MKSKSTALLIALAISGASAWSCSKSSTPAADDKSAAAPASTAPAAASAAATPAAPAMTAAAPKPAAPVASAAPAPVAKPTPAAPTMAAPAASASMAAAPTGPDPRADVKTVVPEAIRLLDAKDYVGFFKSMMPPSQLAQIQIPVEQMAAMMTSDPGAAAQFSQMGDALKQIKDQTPTLDATGNKATFTLNPPVGDHKDISFVKENGLWYLGD